VDDRGRRAIAAIEECAPKKDRTDHDRLDTADMLVKRRAFLRWLGECPMNSVHIGFPPASEHTLEQLEGPDGEAAG
jgi:hypothetical protein